MMSAFDDLPVSIQHMFINSERDLPWFVGGAKHEGELVIVGGAPSILPRMDIIKDRQRKGATILALNGANGCLRAHGVTPDLVLFVDPNPAVVGFITEEPHDTAAYLVASICHPDVFERLEGRDVHIWHPEMPEPELGLQKQILEHYDDRPGSLIGGGCTGALRSLSIGAVLGFRTFHMYGVDSSYLRGMPDHAYEKHDGTEPEAITIMFEGKPYCCSPWMLRQADEFRFYYAQMRSLGAKVHVHGDGLIPDICRWLKKLERTGQPIPMPLPSTIH